MFRGHRRAGHPHGLSGPHPRGSGRAEFRATVLAELPHDSTAYTEGLELDGEVLWEATGMAGQSQLRQLDPANGAVRRAVSLPQTYFGEGITVVNDRIWQVTYRDNVAIEWDKDRMTPLREVVTTGEGGACAGTGTG